MSIILALGSRFARLITRLVGPQSAFSKLVQDSECGGRLLDGLVLWSTALVVAGLANLTVITKLVTEYTPTHSLVATITVSATLFAFLAPMVGFFWGPTAKGGRGESLIDLNSSAPSARCGSQLFSWSSHLGQVMAASLIIFICGLTYLPLKLVGFWLPWTVLAFGIGTTASQWMEINFDERTIRRFAYFYGDSWTLEQQDLNDCKGLIWGGHDLARSEHETHLVHWLTVILGSGHIIKIHSVSQLDGGGLDTPPEAALLLAESLNIPLWIPRENVPLEELAVKFCDNQTETFRIWGQPCPEAQQEEPSVSRLNEKSQKSVSNQANLTDEIDLE